MDVKFDGARRESAAATPLCGRHSLVIAKRGDPFREELERFVQTAFARVHGAQVHSFMPTLLGLHGRRRGVCGVAGFRIASAEPLYLENYLDRPIEQLIRARTGIDASRDHIVEVGNLAGASCRAACHLVALLPRYLLDRNQHWIVFTATNAVRSILQHFDAPVFELGVARADRVASAPDSWGRYYEADPRVMAGFLPAGTRLPAFAHAFA